MLLPLSSPVMDQIHERYLRHFIEQDVVGHMEVDLDGNASDPGRMRIALAFADLTGYTRLTEEAGELEALGIHFGNALCRDGDCFGRDVNIAAGAAARSAGGEVLVTRRVVDRAGPHLEFDRIGEIKLKGFSVSTEMFVARLAHEEE